MDEAYSYGHNSTRDASTLTPRKQVEPLVLPDDIANLPSMAGFVKFAEGFPAADIQLEWQSYPTVAEGFLRVPRPPQGKEDRGEKDKVGTTGEAGGRDGAPELVKEDAPEPADARDLSANLSAQPSEEAQRNAPPVPERQPADRLDPSAPRAAPKAANDDRPEGEHVTDASAKQGDPAPRSEPAQSPAPPPVEDQATIDERHGLGAGRGDDDLGMGD